MFQSRLHLFPLGRVEHQRNFDARHKPRREFMHIGDAVSADEIDVDVEDVCTFAFLRFCKRHEAIPIFCFEQVAHLFRPRSVYPFADYQERRVLRVWLLKIYRRR